jgi:hypothetical protein
MEIPAPHNGFVAQMHAAVIQEDMYTPISCLMIYDMRSPFEVVFLSTEATDGEPVEWHFARDLIRTTLDGEELAVHGEGDVILSRENGFVFILLQSPDGRAIVAFLEADMKTFLSYTENLIPFGKEPVKETDIDAELREILGE